MKLDLPPFIKGTHYAELKGSSSESRGKYRFKAIVDLRIRIPALAWHALSVSFRDADGREWARIDRDVMTMRAGYAWNGCSPKWWVPFLGWIGTPDPEPTRLASGFHDVCFQFFRCADWPFSFSQCNDLFCSIMTQQGFRWAETYHGAVNDFGALYTGAHPKNGEHSVILNPSNP